MSESSSVEGGPNTQNFFSKILTKLEIPVEERQTLSFLRNPDLLPIPREKQTWGFWSNFGYWGIISFSVGTWMSAASALSVGLSYPATIGTFIVGDVVTIMFTLANCYPGWDWKVGYTLSQRFVFGIYGSTIGVLIRVLMSIVNYASNAYLGGLCINMILNSWSHHYLHLPNTLSSHVNVTTKEIIGFVLFHIITAFFYLLRPYQINYILIVACWATCFSMMGIVIYLAHLAGGVGELFTSTKSTATGSAKAWAWVYMISYWFGSVSPGSVNQSDYSRFGSSLTAIYLGTILALLIPTTVVPVFGVIGASTTEKLYGQQFWQPMDIYEYWLKKDYTAGGRAGSFFCGLSFTLAQIAYTISNSGFASGMDLAGILPKYINIPRGALFTALISVALQPWNFYNETSNVFLTVMGSFGIVMTPIISVMICDNLLIRKRSYAVSDAFKAHGEYYFTKGMNWRAFVAWICGMTPGLPGMAWQVNPNYFHNKGIVNFFYGDSFFAFVISFFLYWILCLIFPYKIEVLTDDKDYYGAFDDETARAKGLIPFSELPSDEIDHYKFDHKYEVHRAGSQDNIRTDVEVIEPAESKGKTSKEEVVISRSTSSNSDDNKY